MKVLIKTKISDHKYKDSHGYLICTDCVMARTGKQTYTRDDCFSDGNYTEIEVDRPEEEVFDSKALASFENVPVTIEHPDNNVDPDNYNSLSVGYVRDIKKGIYEGKPVMKGTIVLTDAEAIEKVESGELINLSCGYNCDVVDCDRPYQSNIRGNHLALCEVPRAGITHICDSKKAKDSKLKVTLSTNDFNDEFTYEGEGEPDIQWLQTRYNVDIDKRDHETYISGEKENLEKFLDDHIIWWEDNYKLRPINDSKSLKVKDIDEGYVIVPEKRYKKYGTNSKIERWCFSLKEAKNVASSIEKNDNINMVIINCNEPEVEKTPLENDKDYAFEENDDERTYYREKDEILDDSLEKARKKFRRDNK